MHIDPQENPLFGLDLVLCSTVLPLDRITSLLEIQGSQQDEISEQLEETLNHGLAYNAGFINLRFI
jgi:hypothetical protein